MCIRDRHKDEEVRRLAAMAAANIAVYEGNQVQMVTDGVLPPINDLLKSGNEAIELQAARCLAYLSQHEDNKVQIARDVGIAHFIQLARSRTQDVQILAATCLANLSSVRGVSASWG
eukprot:3434195-Rhodomonas_salina.2